MKIEYLFLLFFSVIAIQPTIAQKSSREEKAAQIEKAFQEMQQLVASKHFEIDIDRVYPQSGHDVTRFNPRGKITIQDSLAKGHLPFFGRAYSLPYGDGGGIEFDAPMQEVKTKVTEKRKKKLILFSFSVPSQNDMFQVQIEVVPAGGCSINVNSNNRAHISYSGTLTPIQEE